jgi:hypothetical protein
MGLFYVVHTSKFQPTKEHSRQVNPIEQWSKLLCTRRKRDRKREIEKQSEREKKREKREKERKERKR